MIRMLALALVLVGLTIIATLGQHRPLKEVASTPPPPAHYEDLDALLIDGDIGAAPAEWCYAEPNLACPVDDAVRQSRP